MSSQYKSREKRGKKHQLIVSMTSISSRVSHILPIIHSLKNQTLPADRIILWLSEDPYLSDKGVPSRKIPKKIRALAESENSNFEIRYTENIGPHRKLLPALREYGDPGNVIATADDDTVYPPLWLERLYRAFLKENCITSYRAKQIVFDEDGALRPYSTWPVLDYREDRKALYLCPTGNNGVLYFPGFFDDRIFDTAFRRMCPSRSDIWFAASAIANNVLTKQLSVNPPDHHNRNIVHTRFPQIPVPIKKRLVTSSWPELWRHNRSINDAVINAVFEYYSIRLE